MNKIPLPIDPHLPTIQDKILSDAPVILCASPGSGKTTRVPARLLEALKSQNNLKKVIVLVPKRISALSAATRVADENNWDLGGHVGYMVRFESKVSRDTQLIFMTDGLFLKKCMDMSFMKDVGYVFFDEFHERKSNMDLILGLMTEQKILYNSVQIIVMSATMNISQLQKYFGICHTIDVKAPPFTLTKNYLATAQRLACDASFYDTLKATTLTAWSAAQKDILIFLPGMKEIFKASEILKPCFPQISIEILHGSLSIEEQKKIVTKNHAHRRIILTTNIAESSITLPDLDCVIDSGLEKNIETEKKIGFSKLNIERISYFSTLQREGRAARTSHGYCYKLWHPVDERSMAAAIIPEVLSSSLYAEILFLSMSGTTDFEGFSWLDSPRSQQIQNVVKDLIKWRLLLPSHEITDLGRLVALSPVNITNSILFIELIEHEQLASYINDSVQIAYMAELIARLDTLENKTSVASHKSENDLLRLFASPMNFNQNKLKALLIQFAESVKNKKIKLQSTTQIQATDDLSKKLFKIYSKYFPHRIIAKKTGGQGLSSNGRGVELSNESCSQQFDFYVALSGYEKNESTTVVTYAVGVNKLEAINILAENTQYTQNVYFDEVTEVFFKQETLYYGAFKLNEKSKEKLSTVNLNKTWKESVRTSPSAFLKLNSSYLRILELFQFLKGKQNELKINSQSFLFLDNFEAGISEKLVALIDTFEDFKSADIYYYLKDLVPETIYDLLAQLPKSIKLPSGKHVEVNYQDPKAPMISAKIQDCFGWIQTPQILNGRLRLTLELLAPNMRPTQTTSDLENFWKNSYLEVRKDLRARYPKHSWPEDPTKI